MSHEQKSDNSEYVTRDEWVCFACRKPQSSAWGAHLKHGRKFCTGACVMRYLRVREKVYLKRGIPITVLIKNFGRLQIEA